VLTAAWSALLLLDENLPVPAGPVTTWYDGTPASEVALLLAQRLAHARGQRLHVMLPAAGAAGRELRLRAKRHAAGALFSLLAPAADTLAAIASVRGGLLVLPAQPLGSRARGSSCCCAACARRSCCSGWPANITST
jgi:hypothetical protein